MINRSWTKIFTPFPWNCLIDYDIVTWYLLLFLLSHVNTSLLYKIVITVKLSQFDNASSWSESLFVINKLWIRRKYFVFSATLAESTFKWFHCHQLSDSNNANASCNIETFSIFAKEFNFGDISESLFYLCNIRLDYFWNFTNHFIF